MVQWWDVTCVTLEPGSSQKTVFAGHEDAVVIYLLFFGCSSNVLARHIKTDCSL